MKKKGYSINKKKGYDDEFGLRLVGGIGRLATHAYRNVHATFELELGTRV